MAGQQGSSLTFYVRELLVSSYMQWRPSNSSITRSPPPSEKLDVILKAPGNTSHEGKARLRSSVTLDSLYLSAFQDAFDGVDTEDNGKVRIVIGSVVLAANPLPPSAIATIAGLGKQEVMNLLQLIQSLLKFSEDPDSPVLPFHKSFPDFITNPLRCPDKHFYISREAGHLELALGCLKLMNNTLKPNLLSLPDYVLNSEVEDLQARIDNHISVSLEYACRYWSNHLIEAKGYTTTILPVLDGFLKEKFLAWLEVLSVIEAASGAVASLDRLMSWALVCFVLFYPTP